MSDLFLRSFGLIGLFGSVLRLCCSVCYRESLVWFVLGRDWKGSIVIMEIRGIVIMESLKKKKKLR